MRAAVDIIIVGAGHAGVEAALAAARMGRQVALVTHDLSSISRMSCNPALGGLGKGHLIREVDALGGAMGLLGDATGIHFRRLNTRKGAAVRGTRAQSDRHAYSRAMLEVLRAQPRLELVEAEVSALRVAGGRARGVELGDGQGIAAEVVVLTTGTFLAGLMHIGDQQRRGGREGGDAAFALSESLATLGLPLQRLKTGTPCRLDGRTLDHSRMEPQPGDDPPPPLSAWSRWPQGRPPLRQVPCHITHTTERTHEIIRENLQRSAIFSGAINSSGPRYCPSIEDKVVRFADRTRHQIFVEPEGLDTIEVYPNGISTSLPADVQQALIASIPGFERARIVRLGYAVEYDFVDPRALRPSLELRDCAGLYLAGQINGTTGYEEAAAQGMLAGINAALQLDDKEPLRLGRDQAYLGVLVDDLITRGVGGEPYRMFTSRAEYRLLLREDNATARLTPIGRELGLIDDERWARFCEQQERVEQLKSTLRQTRVTQRDGLAALCEAAGTPRPRVGTSLSELLLRPEVDLSLMARAGVALDDNADVRERAEIDIKYAPYIERQRDDARRLAALEDRRMPDDLDYHAIVGLSNEVKEKLHRQRPVSIAQACRIPGITPAAIALLDVHLRVRAAACGG